MIDPTNVGTDKPTTSRRPSLADLQQRDATIAELRNMLDRETVRLNAAVQQRDAASKINLELKEERDGLRNEIASANAQMRALESDLARALGYVDRVLDCERSEPERDARPYPTNCDSEIGSRGPKIMSSLAIRHPPAGWRG